MVIIMTREKRRRFKRIGIIIITVLIIMSVISMTATAIIYDSIFARYDGADVDPPHDLVAMVNARQTAVYPSGNNRLTGYLYRSNDEQDRQTLIVLAPGFRAEADDYLWQIKSFLELGWSVFAFDATGSGESEGESSVGFPQEIYDIEATLKYIENCNRFGYNDIVLFGHSRGGYAACCALSMEFDIAAVVSVSGINSAMEGVIGAAHAYVGPVAYGNYGFLWLYQTILFDAKTVNITADEAISQSDVPVLVVHGAADEQVPIDRFSIMAHRDDIDSNVVEYLICDEPERDGHTSLLFDEDGMANRELITDIDAFLSKHIFEG